MAYLVLFGIADLRLRPPSINEEDRVVAESAFPGWFESDGTFLHALKRDRFPAGGGWPCQRHDGAVAGPAPSTRDALKLAQEQRRPPYVIQASTPKPRREHAGPALKRINLNAGIIGQREALPRFREGAGLKERILLVRRPCFVDVEAHARLRRGLHGKTERLEQAAKLAHLPGVIRGEEDRG